LTLGLHVTVELSRSLRVLCGAILLAVLFAGAAFGQACCCSC